MRLLFFLLLSLPLTAQTIKPSSFGQFIKTPNELAVWSAEAVGHTLDFTSTQEGLRTPGLREAVMPWLTPHKYWTAAYEGSYVAAAPFVSYLFYKHGHRKLGYALQFVDASVFLGAGIFNYTEIEQIKAESGR